MTIPSRFVRVDPEEMDDRLGPVLVHRTLAGWIYYCRADKISEELAREFEALANRYTQTTISLTTPTEPRPEIRMHRLPPEQMPAPLQPAVLDLQDTVHTVFVRDDLITQDMAEAMVDINAEQNRYARRLPVIAPLADP
ncbi:hypothetical protein E1264_39575 [Actinomadura sp. KC216]|uniref:hypothetical protein n=1 Tax=Actinomadura sp. KC216 TaxID=2530370 RepID=UPI0010448BE2|nr:hypothetical protein [Actinomadura sp. KC216]TDB75647.1 hypothetical protein E1264_39575 [Actinomadura sp. KC216]